MGNEKPKRLEGKSELVVLILGALGSMGSNMAMPTSVEDLVTQLNGIDPHSPVYYMFIAYIIVRGFRKWSKDHHLLQFKKLELEERRLDIKESGQYIEKNGQTVIKHPDLKSRQ